jgi:hypothetical protein
VNIGAWPAGLKKLMIDNFIVSSLASFVKETFWGFRGSTVFCYHKAEKAYRDCAMLLTKTMTLSQSRKKIARSKTIATTIKMLSSMSRL